MIMKIFARLVTAIFLTVCFTSVYAQVSIPGTAIPSTPGEVMRFFVAADTSEGIPVDIGEAGADRSWDFTVGTNDSTMIDSLFNPLDGPNGDMFPDADRGILSGGMMGLNFGMAYRYEDISEDNWTLQGLVVYAELDTLIEEPIELALPFDEPLLFAPLPMTYEDSWSIDDSIHYYYTEEETGAEFLVVLEYGGTNCFDAWGTATYPGGESECLRMHAHLGGTISIYPIVFGVPLPIPIYVQEIALTHAYMWIAPDVGELATVVSFPDSSENIERAALVRRRNTIVSKSPDDLVNVPKSFTVSPAWPNPFNASTQIQYSLPNDQFVNIEVFDMLGRSVAKLYSGKESAGRHIVSLNNKSLASGYYFVRFSTDLDVHTQKVTLIK